MLLQKRAQEEQEEQETNRQKVLDVAEIHGRAQQAVLEKMEEKAAVGKEVAQESKALLEQAAKIEEQEAAKRYCGNIAALVPSYAVVRCGGGEVFGSLWCLGGTTLKVA